MTSLPPAHSALLSQAGSFLSDMVTDSRFKMKGSDVSTRLDHIAKEIEETGTYTHTDEELRFGVQWAWRSSNRCIGRHMWRTLKIQDCRDIRTRDGVADALQNHLNTAWKGGDLESVITVFPPRIPGEPHRPDPVRPGMVLLTPFKTT